MGQFVVANPAWSMIAPGRAGSVETIRRNGCASSVMLRRPGRGYGTNIKALPTTRGSAFLALAYGLSQHPHDQSTRLASSSRFVPNTIHRLALSPTQRGRPLPYLLAHSDSRRSATVSPAGMTITSKQELHSMIGQKAVKALHKRADQISAASKKMGLAE